ncbi:hypothetical protein ASJ33_08075 [Dehalococcoides mccartyi]|jgi:hypothetical protein|nr:hypothetical protein X792_07475 [Dehalococcoides mccartyi CG1]APH13116.1 hypothetical protein ASJ33_08075 [Dehalococcoides mccartyi]
MAGVLCEYKGITLKSPQLPGCVRFFLHGFDGFRVFIPVNNNARIGLFARIWFGLFYLTGGQKICQTNAEQWNIY